MREGYEAFNRGDFDAATELMHPEIEFKRAEIAPEAGEIRGAEAMRAWMVPDVFEFYADRPDAREAAGLDPQG
jgi:ketosteroid isomerase-like protein